MTSIDSTTPTLVVDPAASSLYARVCDKLEQLPCTLADIPLLLKLFAVLDGKDGLPAANGKPKSTRGYKINVLRPDIDKVLLNSEHPTGRFTVDEILDALKKINCPHLVRDDNVNRDSIRETVVKNSKCYSHDKIEKTFSLRRAMKPRVPRAA